MSCKLVIETIAVTKNSVRAADQSMDLENCVNDFPNKNANF